MATEQSPVPKASERRRVAMLYALAEFASQIAIVSDDERDFSFARMVTAASYGDERSSQRVDQAIEELLAVIRAVDTSKSGA